MNDPLEEVEEERRFLKAAVPILGKRGVVRNLLIEAQPGKPAISQVHPNLLDQAALTGNAVQVSDQQNAQEHFGIDRRPTRVAVARLQGLAYKREIDVPIDKSQQVIFGNVIFEPEVVEQRLRTSVLTHHDEQRASAKIN